MRQEFIFTAAPFASCHASTLAATGEGLVAAWFAGDREGARNVGIWVARRQRGGWTEPIEIARGAHRGRPSPCWNPVLFQPRQGPLRLYFKVGPSPRRWWGMQTQSDDGGATWSPPERLAYGILGPIKNKPIERADGTWLSPSSCERDRWRVHIERSTDHGVTWHRGPPINDGRTFAAIQPSLLDYPDGRLQLLCRTRQGAIGAAWSTDGGRHWSDLAALPLPNPDSGIDAVMLAGGSAVLVYNHAQTARTPLNLAVSADGGTWQAARVVEDTPGEFSYPALIRDDDDRLHLTYTWNRRRIRYATLSAADFRPVPIASGHWPDEAAAGA